VGNKVGYIIQLQDRFSRSAKKINSSMKGIDKSANKAARTINKKLTGSLKGLKGAAVNAAAGLAAFFGVREFFTVGAQFQDSMADLSAITGAVGEDFDKLTTKTLNMAKEFVTSQSEVARGIKLVASAKPELLGNLDALTETTKQVLLLKNAAGIDLQSAANITAQSLNQFGADASQAAKFVNILAAGAKLGSSEIAETGAATVIAGPAARAAGLSFLQLNAAIQVTAKGGIKAEKAGTALNSIFGRLRRQGFDFQKLGLEGTLRQVKSQLDRVTNSTRRAQLESKLFGEEHSKVGLALLNNVGMLGEYEKSLEGTNVAQEQSDIRLATFNSKMKGLGITINDILIKTFLRLAPTITKQVESLGMFFDTLDSDRVDAFAESLVKVADAIGIIGKGVGFVAKGFDIAGTFLGEEAARAVMFLSGDFDALRALQLEESGLDVNGIGPARRLNNITNRSQTDVNVNLRAPENTIESVKSKTAGKSPGLNVGVNMATGG
jgi:TP901 family phage tail tape measure protein